jgi:hypothetical protein
MTNTDIQLIEQIDHEFYPPQVEIHETGLKIKESIDIQQWLDLTEKTLRFDDEARVHSERENKWRIADVLNYGEEHFPQEYAQAFDPEKHGEKTLLNYMRVGKAIEPVRRRKQLSFGHHSVIYKLEFEQQEEMLNLAVQNGYSVSQFRKAVREAYPSKKRSKSNPRAKEGGTELDCEVAMDDATAVHYLRGALAYLETNAEKTDPKEWPENVREDFAGIIGGIKRFARKAGF